MSDANITCIWDAKAILGESPLYDPRDNKLYWLDIKQNQLFVLNISREQSYIIDLPEQLSSIALHEKGGFVTAGKKGFSTLKISESRKPIIKTLTDPEKDKPLNRFNDGKADPNGGFWAGSMEDAETDTKAGNWWRLCPDGQVTLLDSGFHVTNGPAFDPRTERVYFTDSARQIVFYSSYAEEFFPLKKKKFLSFDKTEGYPDGMTVDCYGNLWIAFWDGYCIRQYSPGGELILTIRMPVPRPTSLTIIGAALYITSAAIGLSDDGLKRYPLSGGLFRVGLSESLEPAAFYYTGKK